MRQVQHFINGEHVAGTGARKGDIYNPNTGEIQAQVDLADASIMPGVPRANTNLTCFMIGEKVGEWLRVDASDYGL